LLNAVVVIAALGNPSTRVVRLLQWPLVMIALDADKESHNHEKEGVGTTV